MTAAPAARLFTLAIIPAFKSPVAVLWDGALVEQCTVSARGDAIASLLSRVRTQQPSCEICVVVQDAPWPRTDAPATSSEIGRAQAITETTARWAALCEEHGLRLARVRRATWIVSLLNRGVGRKGPDDRLDAMRTAQELAHASVLPTHADAVCLAYWHVAQDGVAATG